MYPGRYLNVGCYLVFSLKTIHLLEFSTLKFKVKPLFDCREPVWSI